MTPIRDVQYTGQPHHISHFLQNCILGRTCETVYCAMLQDMHIKIRYRGKTYAMAPFEWMTVYHDGTIRVSEKKDLAPLPADHAADW